MGVVLRQRTIAAVERDLAHARRGVLLNQLRASDERAEMIEEGAHNRVFCPNHVGQLVGPEQDAAHDRQPIRFIGVEEGRRRSVTHHHREFPGQVDVALHFPYNARASLG
jgi:hypothetical protein